MDPKQQAATETQTVHHDLAVLRALEEEGTSSDVAKRLEDAGEQDAADRVEELLSYQVYQYRVMRIGSGWGSVYRRTPLGSQALADHALRQDGRA